jgi:dynein heavy chain
MAKDFKSYYDLWTVVETWKKSHHSWLYDPFDEIDASGVETLVDDSAKTISACIRFFRDKDDLRKILKIAEEMRTGIDDFKPQVPILMALRTDGMKDRHWEMLSEKIGFEVKPYEGFTYQKCMEMKLTEYTEQVVDIGEKAGKEYNIETSLAKMKQDWEPLTLGLKPFKNTGTYTVFGFDDAMMMLDEHIVLT